MLTEAEWDERVRQRRELWSRDTELVRDFNMWVNSLGYAGGSSGLLMGLYVTYCCVDDDEGYCRCYPDTFENNGATWAAIMSQPESELLPIDEVGLYTDE